MGLVGVESEKLQETMLRVQSAMALAQGLEGLEDAGRAFKQLGSVAINALKGIKGALAATGIGLFVVALGTIVAYWDDIKAAVSGVSEEQRQLTIQSSANLEIEKKKLDTIDSQDNVLKLQGKSEKEILKYKIAQTDQTIKSAEINLESQIQQNKAALEGEKRNYNLLKSYLEFVSMPLNFLYTNAAKGINALIKLINKIPGFEIDVTVPEDLVDKGVEALTKLAFDPEQTKKDGEAQLEEQKKYLAKLKNDRAGYELQIKQINADSVKSAQDIAKDELDKKLQAEKAELDALIELEVRKDQTDKARLEKLLADRLALEKLKGNQLLIAQQDNAEKVRQAIADDNKEELHLETVKIDKLKVLSNTKLENLQGSLNAEIEAERNAALLKTQILDAQAVRAQKIDERANSFKVKSIQQGLEIVSSITELFGKKSEKQAKRAFQVQKAAQVASALINTYQSATGAYASQFLPVPDPTSPVRGGIAAGLAVAAGLVNVAKIASQKFEGGSQGGGGGGAPAGGVAGGQVQAPQFQTIGTSGVNQLATLQQQPTKAYVVSGEVTSAQSLDRNRVQNATL
jgi:hypothetical protein